MNHKRYVFFISDGTGITAETLGLSLISQFRNTEFVVSTLPYIDSAEKVDVVLEQLEEIYQTQGDRPIVFTTLMDPALRTQLSQSPSLVIDLFAIIIPSLEKELGTVASGEKGRSHAVEDHTHYLARMEAINFTLETDDGLHPKKYEAADVILLGVSRSGKTPTSLYLAMHYGLRAANYPLTPDDFPSDKLPAPLLAHQKKCFGLTINPQRLQQIRQQRRPQSQYCDLKQCEKEVMLARQLFLRNDVPFLDTTSLSVEEISTRIVTHMNIGKRWSL